VDKNDQNRQFEVWLAAYNKRLIEIARTCVSGHAEEKISEDQGAPREGSAVPTQIRPKAD